jgi:hypothetical protein
LLLWFRELIAMMSLMALTDKVLRESGLFSVQDSQAQAKQAEMFVCFLNRPGTPPYRVAEVNCADGANG